MGWHCCTWVHCNHSKSQHRCIQCIGFSICSQAISRNVNVFAAMPSPPCVCSDPALLLWCMFVLGLSTPNSKHLKPVFCRKVIELCVYVLLLLLLLPHKHGAKLCKLSNYSKFWGKCQIWIFHSFIIPSTHVSQLRILQTAISHHFIESVVFHQQDAT